MSTGNEGVWLEICARRAGSLSIYRCKASLPRVKTKPCRYRCHIERNKPAGSRKRAWYGLSSFPLFRQRTLFLRATLLTTANEKMPFERTGQGISKFVVAKHAYRWDYILSGLCQLNPNRRRIYRKRRIRSFTYSS